MSIEHFNNENLSQKEKEQPVFYRVYTIRGVIPGFLKESILNQGIETGSIKDVIHIEVITSFNEAT